MEQAGGGSEQSPPKSAVDGAPGPGTGRRSARARRGKYRERRLWVVLSLVLLGGLLDYLSGPAVAATLFFLVPVTLAAWWAGWRAGAAAACAAAGIDAAIHWLHPIALFPPAIVAVNQGLRLATMLCLAFLAARLRDHTRALAEQRDRLAQLHERLEQNVRAARTLQELLAGSLPQHPNAEIGTYFQPARLVGGDLCDLLLTADGRLVIAVGDVAGRGVPAALAAAALLGMLEDAPARHHSPAETLRFLNQRLVGRLPEEMFVSLFYALLDLQSGELTYASAGHDPPFLLRRDGDVEELPLTGLPLAVDPEAAYRQRRLSLRNGDLLFCYTDGITDVRQPAGERLGAERLRRLVIAALGRPCPELAHWVAAAANSPNGDEARDDVTLLAIRYRGS